MTNSIEIDKLWLFSEPSTSEKRFNELRDKMIESNNTQAIQQINTQIARALGLQQKFDDGHSVLNKIDYNSCSPLTKVRYHLERGRLYNSDNDKVKALSEFNKAWEIATTITDEPYYAVDAAHMIAIAHKDPESQLSWNRTAIRHAENSKDERAKKWLGSLLNNTGWSYFDQGKFNDALDLFTKALDFRKSIGDENTIRIAKWCIGRTYRAMNEIDTAFKIMKELEDEFVAKGLEVGGYTLEELAELHHINHNTNEAKKYFKLAYESLSKDIWLQRNEPKRLERLKQMSL